MPVRSRSPIQQETKGESGSESESELYSKAYLDGLLQKARDAVNPSGESSSNPAEEEFMRLQSEEADGKDLPSLDASRLLPEPYFENLNERNKVPNLSKGVLVESVASSSNTPALPEGPVLGKDGKPLTKREMKELRRKSAKIGYFELPTPDDAQLAKIRKEAEAVRLRNALDPKTFYRKDAVINVKNMPKQIALGTILPTTTPFGTASTDNLTRAERKRSIVDELVEDSEAKRYAKRKFEELQGVHRERGRDTLTRKRLARKPKW
ncbi:SubName: Full=Uncharacterized protein {ECO:0000313/EMBL:CCA70306.1} [Serendipita indica DSM 11827]|uniref:Fcf2 pre-rRNA processing C-terminal domain-containing protein n=1 Tax=Serendipita indica (strain DSM 11827) TaxID=1109443 RepID=G4TG65_SERID|nr:SubName: Full=Uncharacterized protein {ECO:0000313/EMBL:CCA70306.1} [Serendipita indica DSM 11827]CCA70306.1 hypothetical protein PIIN_04245 [Serendipita indica DSM 11827]